MNANQEPWIDRFGATASSLCAVHCAVCALLPAAFAALGLGVLLSHKAEFGLALVAIVLGLFAMRLAWKTHRSPQVTALLALGILGLMSSRGLEMSSTHDHHGEHGHMADSHHETHEEPHHDHGSDGHHDNGHASGEHDAHDDEHHGDEHHDDEHHDDEHHDDEHHDDDGLHLAGAGIGILGGLLLAIGHILNLRAVARCREEHCA